MEVPEEGAEQLAKRQAIQAIMRDASLAPQEKQAKIQELQRGGVRLEGSESAPAPSKQSLIAAVMKESSLSAQQRQAKIQEIMKGGGTSVPPAAAQSISTASPTNGSESPTLQDSRSYKVGASTSTGPDPSAKKTVRVSTISAPSAAMTTSERSAPPPMVGASASKAADPASRKGARTTSTGAVHSLDAVPDPTGAEPAPLSRTSAGAVSSKESDPSATKASDRRMTGAAPPSATSGASQSAGALSGSRHDDPAARKNERGNRGSSRTPAPDTQSTSGSAPVIPLDSGKNGDEGIGELSNTSTAAATLKPPSSVGAPAVSGLADGAALSNGAEPFVANRQPPTIVENRPASFSEQPEMYAGVGLIGPDVAGADTGGIQVCSWLWDPDFNHNRVETKPRLLDSAFLRPM
jgi:hypothetical protein